MGENPLPSFANRYTIKEERWKDEDAIDSCLAEWAIEWKIYDMAKNSIVPILTSRMLF